MQIFDATVAVDGHGVWPQRLPDGRTVRVPFFAEIDLGTEDLRRVAGKVTAYEKFARTTGRVWPVLFWLGSTVRERHLYARPADQNTFVPVAAAARDLAAEEGQSPAANVWWLHDHPGPSPRSLADLAATVIRIAQAGR